MGQGNETRLKGRRRHIDALFQHRGKKRIDGLVGHDLAILARHQVIEKNTITFPNGSVILMKDLFAYPSDPNFDELGSLEITGAFIDEVNQISVKARNIVKSRIRYKLNDFTLYGESTLDLKVMEYDENDEPCCPLSGSVRN